LALIGGAILASIVVGCGAGSAQVVTPEQEKAWRHPPKTAPPEYHGAFQGIMPNGAKPGPPGK